MVNKISKNKDKLRQETHTGTKTFLKKKGKKMSVSSGLK